MLQCIPTVFHYSDVSNWFSVHQASWPRYKGSAATPPASWETYLSIITAAGIRKAFGKILLPFMVKNKQISMSIWIWQRMFTKWNKNFAHSWYLSQQWKTKCSFPGGGEQWKDILSPCSWLIQTKSAGSRKRKRKKSRETEGRQAGTPGETHDGPHSQIMW